MNYDSLSRLVNDDVTSSIHAAKADHQLLELLHAGTSPDDHVDHICSRADALSDIVLIKTHCEFMKASPNALLQWAMSESMLIKRWLEQVFCAIDRLELFVR